MESPPSSPFLSSPLPSSPPLPPSSPFLSSPTPSDPPSSPFLLSPLPSSPPPPRLSLVPRIELVLRPTRIPPPPSGPLRKRPERPASRLPVPVTRQAQPSRPVSRAQPPLVSQALVDRRQARQQRVRPWLQGQAASRRQRPLRSALKSPGSNTVRAAPKRVAFCETKTVKKVSYWMNRVPPPWRKY